jgi:hypothetical protein
MIRRGAAALPNHNFSIFGKKNIFAERAFGSSGKTGGRFSVFSAGADGRPA